ncbi:hypothetical protein BGW38_007508, partial [Lunasporangiospora selenospora]
PTGPPSVCLTTPTDSTCSNYTIPASTISAAVSDICKASSFLPGCSLNTACADHSLNQTYCAPLTVLATLCTAKEDTALTGAACSKSYQTFCSNSSLIPACKTQVAFPELPSGKIATGLIYSVCQEMPGMKGCKICPAPEASTGYSVCDEMAALKDLCLDMPEMTQCPSYNKMCNSTKFAPFCSANSSGGHGGHGGHGNNNQTTPGTDKGKNDANAMASSLVMTSVLAAIAGLVSMTL